MKFGMLLLLSFSAPLAPLLGGGVRDALLGDLQRSAKEGWEYSGSGGYVFRYLSDLVGDDEPEMLVSFSIRPGAWHVFSGSGYDTHVGVVEASGMAPLEGEKAGGKTIVRVAHAAKNYDEPPFEAFAKYVIDTVVSDAGVEQRTRVVGEDAPLAEYLDLRQGAARIDGDARPVIEFVSLRDFLSAPAPEWQAFRHEEWELADGYYLHQDDAERVQEIKTSVDDARLSELRGDFTLQDALAMLRREPPELPATSAGRSPPFDASRRGSSAALWIIAGLGILAVLLLLCKKRPRAR